MANVCCTSNVSFSVNEDEKEVLQREHDIIEGIKHDWFVKDENAWDNEDYWEVDNAVKILETLFSVKKCER